MKRVMRVIIDTSQIVYGTGVSVYTENLVRNLLVLDKKSRYVLFGGSLRQKGELTDILSEFSQKNVDIKIYPFAPSMLDLMWNRLSVLPIELFCGKADVYHSSDWVQAPFGGFKVTTVHDLSPFLFPDETPKKIVAVHKRRFEKLKREVDRVIVPSLATKKDCIRFGIDESRIRVVSEAVDRDFKPKNKSEVDLIKAKYKIEGDYFLAVGTSKRKNLNKIVNAFNNYRKIAKLLVVGEKRKFDFKITKEVVFLGRIPKQDLIGLYNGALALLYPSFYEGFGLPVLEAMACRCPVVTSKRSSLSEVGGDACVYVDPSSIESIIDGIDQILKDRDSFIKKGLKRAREFSWRKSALDTLSVYNEFRL